MATTRGLEETPYLGSTRLANLFDEAQLARTRHAAMAAMPRAIRTIDFCRIPIRPSYQSNGGKAYFDACTPKPRCGPPPHQGVKISQLEHGGNGVSVSVVNQWLPQISPKPA